MQKCLKCALCCYDFNISVLNKWKNMIFLFNGPVKPRQIKTKVLKAAVALSHWVEKLEPEAY